MMYFVIRKKFLNTSRFWKNFDTATLLPESWALARGLGAFVDVRFLLNFGMIQGVRGLGTIRLFWLRNVSIVSDYRCLEAGRATSVGQCTSLSDCGLAGASHLKIRSTHVPCISGLFRNSIIEMNALRFLARGTFITYRYFC